MSSDSNQATSRGQWSSSFGFIMAAAGSAVGLGNLWKFPFLVGQNGGSAFLIVYALFVVFIGLSLVIAEITIGKYGQLNPIGSYNLISPKLKWVGTMGILTGFIILAYYPVVGGWILYYLCNAFQKATPGINCAQMFDNYTSSYLPLITLCIYSILNYVIVALGVEKGIEKYSKIMMPSLFIILLIILIRTVTLDKGWEGINFLLKPDFSKLTGKVLLDAVGQVFFSLSLGMGALMTYGSYMKKEENLLVAATSIPAIDTAIAFFAAVSIMPAVFAFGFEPTAGPKLIFVTLPAVFAQMPWGNFIAVIFFTLMLFAAITSSISMTEGLVSYLIDKRHWRRFTATTTVCFTCLLMGIPTALSFGPMKNILFFGKSIFDALDFLASNILLPCGGIMLCISVGWIWDGGLRNLTKVQKTEDGTEIISNSYVFNAPLKEITNNGKLNFPFMEAWIFLIKWICPLVIAIIFLYNL